MQPQVGLGLFVSNTTALGLPPKQRFQTYRYVMLFIYLGLTFSAVAFLLFWLFKMPPKANPFVPSDPPIVLEDCKKKMLKALKRCPKTGVPYLVIGCGFLGSRIIEFLLHRKENVTVFDFDENSPWAKDSRVIPPTHDALPTLILYNRSSLYVGT